MAKNQNEKATVQLIINGQQAKTSLKEVRLALISLEREMSKMKKEDDPIGFERTRQQLARTRQAYGQMQAEIRGGQGSLNRFGMSWKDIAGGLIGGNIAMMAIQKTIGSLVGLVTQAGELSDSLSDVQKQTDLSGTELESLNAQLQAISTRTPVEELRNLAAQAGRLGYKSKEDILEFVKAADMINVALGDALGADATKDIAKLTDIFKLKEIYGVEGAMLRVGSAINDIGMASTANEGYIVDFLKRMSGISGIANVSVQELIALGGTLDSLGQTSEVSSTALNKLLVKMGSDIPTYSKMAGVSMDEFRKVMNRSAVEGLMLVLKEVGKTTNGMEQLSETLGDLGLDGGRVVGVLGTLANNTEEYSRQLGISSSAMEKNTSITNEFNVKNQNAASVMAKLGKAASNMWENIAMSVGKGIVIFGRLVGLIDTTQEAVAKFEDQQQKVNGMQANMLPLIKRYEELKKNVGKSTEEQAEMKKILEQIAEVMPNSITQFDQYGNAIEISTGKAREAIEVQRQLLKALNKDAVREIDREIGNQEFKIRNAQKLLNDKSGTVEYDGRKGYVKKQRSDERQQEIITNYKEATAELQKLQNKRKELLGEAVVPSTIVKPIKPIVPEKPDPAEGTGKTGKGGKSGKVSETERINDELLKNQQKLTIDMLSEQEKELQAAQYKYEELTKKAKGNAAQLAQIEAQSKQEISQISDKYNEKYLTDFDKTMRGQLGHFNEVAQIKNAADAAQKENTLKLQDDAYAILLAEYEREILIAEQTGADKLLIMQNFYLQMNELHQKQNAKEIKDFADKETEKRKIDAETAKTEQENFESKGLIAKRTAGIIGDVMSISAKNQEEAAEYQKTVALVQLAIDTTLTTVSAVRAAVSGSENVYMMVANIALAVGTVTAAIASAKQMMKKTDVPDAPAFRADGGSTDLASIMRDTSGNPEGWVTKPTLFSLGRRSYVAGEAGTEYVLSNSMLKNPAIADFASGVEALRQNRFFANGGSTAMPTTQTSQTSMEETNQLLRDILQKEGNWNYKALEKYKDDIDKVRNRAKA